jgi:hypothetical protein
MMALLLTISGGVAFLVAFGLLHAGIVSMAARYGVAAIVGYVLLLCMFRFWLWAVVRRIARVEQESDNAVGDIIADVLSDVPLPDIDSAEAPLGGGGGFGGAGGGSSWGGGHSPAAEHGLQASRHAIRTSPRSHVFSAHHVGSESSSGGDGGFDIGIDIDLDDGWIIVIPIIAAVAIGAVVIGVVWTAPTLFAELLLDALVGAGIYRGLRRWETSYWLESAVRRTRWAAAAVIFIAITTGYLIQHFAPGTVSIGDLWR